VSGRTRPERQEQATVVRVRDRAKMMAEAGRRPGGYVLKSPREIELMRQAGAVVHRVLAEMERLVQPGVITADLNRRAEERIAEAGGVALFKGVVNPQARFPFPAALCISVNEEIVHGMPGDRVLKEGNIVSIDCGVKLNGYCGDAAVTLAVGDVSTEAQHLLDVTREVLGLAIRQIAPAKRWSEIAAQMQRFVESQNLSVVRDFVGHGIGRTMHEDPKVPNYWDRDSRSEDFRLEKGMTLAIEPMVNLGSMQTRPTRDSWTVVTRDGKMSAHFEHTVAVTEWGADVLTDGRPGGR
jgi:methionyl aminopeptidase